MRKENRNHGSESVERLDRRYDVSKKMHRQLVSIVALFLALCCTACSGGGSDAPKGAGAADAASSENRQAHPQPKCLLSDYHEEQATEIEGGSIDFSALSDGYIAVEAEAGSRLKFQIIKGAETYTYDLPEDGTVTVYPLNMGDGDYQFRLMRQVEGTKYTEAWGDAQSVALSDEFTPYLRPNQIVNYNRKSACVAEAYQVTQYCENDLEIAAAVYDYLAKNITYDYDKAQTVQSGYLPDPDSTLASKNGICFDYAALAAAMMRSQGVPCQVITGYMGPDELYHAWNRFYVKNEGWLTVEIQAAGSSWKRVDITAAAAGTSAAELEDDQQYTTRYIY